MKQSEFVEYLEQLIEALESWKDELESGYTINDAPSVFQIDEGPLLSVLNGEELEEDMPEPKG